MNIDYAIINTMGDAYWLIMDKHKNFIENIFRVDDDLVPPPSMYHEIIAEQYWLRYFRGNLKKLIFLVKKFKGRPQYRYFPNIINVIQQEEQQEYEEYLEPFIGYL